MDDKQFQVLSTKLDSIIKLLAMSATSGKTLRDQVRLLSSFGFQPKQIADILGKTSGHIRVILYDIKKQETKVREVATSKEETENE